MNLVFILIVVAVLGAAFFLQKHSGMKPDADTRAAIELAEATPTPAGASPAPRGESSPHTYLKRALDRARDVRDQERSRTQAAQEP